MRDGPSDREIRALLRGVARIVALPASQGPRGHFHRRILQEPACPLTRGQQVAEKVFNDAIKSVTGLIPGAVSFKLYDTYGLALDEQEDMAREHSLAIDRAGFDQEMEQQRERARASWKGAEKGERV